MKTVKELQLTDRKVSKSLILLRVTMLLPCTRMLTFTASDVNTGCKTVLLKMLLSGMRLAFSTA